MVCLFFRHIHINIKKQIVFNKAYEPNSSESKVNLSLKFTCIITISIYVSSILSVKLFFFPFFWYFLITINANNDGQVIFALKANSCFFKPSQNSCLRLSFELTIKVQTNDIKKKRWFDELFNNKFVYFFFFFNKNKIAIQWFLLFFIHLFFKLSKIVYV